MTPAPDPRRVAEVIAGSGGAARRGSGYLVRRTAVLTAAHVVAGARSVRVRFDADRPSERVVAAVPAWTSSRHDLAVLAVEPGADDGPVPDARFGRVGDRAAVLNVRAVGFPRFKLRDDAPGTGASTRYRDTHQADGSVAVLSNRREGTLEVTVPVPPAAPAGRYSPWEGMSGAALWCGDRIVGVLAKHHPTDGPGRLAAARLDRCLDSLAPDDRRRLAELLGPGSAGPLPDVLPPGRSDAVRRAELAAVREMFAPERLLDREEELAELVRFCAGPRPWLWWQAGPWAGKTALLASFVLDPPTGVDVVSFFVTRRVPGGADSGAFTASAAEQLSALADAAGPPSHRPGAVLPVLVEAAAERAREAGRVLLLVVDGLDEDTAADTGLPSIASLLPRRPPDNVRVLVSSRPHPPLPADVRGDHPLRSCPVRELSPSPHARSLEHEANHELRQVLREAGPRRELLGLIAASGGGLTRPDLEHLTGRSPVEVADLLEGSLGRSLAGRGPAYHFSHDSLRARTEESLGGAALDGRRARLHAWADAWHERGWPDGSPDYLLHGYPHLLLATRDLPRLARCATDRHRHDRMRLRTGNDLAALTEIGMAQDLNVRRDAPDLPLAVRLALRRDDVARRYADMPSTLPAVWELLGEHSHAEALARSLDDPSRRRSALSNLAEAAAEGGDHPRAEAVAELIGASETRLWTLAWLADRAGDPDEAESLALSMTMPGSLLTALAVAAESRGDRELAERRASLCHPVYLHHADGLYARCAVAAARRGDHDRARDLVRRIADEDADAAQAETLIDIAAAGPDRTRARDAAARLAGTIEDTALRHHVLARIAAYDGDWDLAERHECSVEDAEGLAEFDWLVRQAAEAGDYDRAEALAHEHPSATSPRPWALITLAAAMAANGDYRHAERLARSLPTPEAAAEALAQTAAAAARAGDHAEARRCAVACEDAMRSDTDPALQADGLIAALRALGADPSRAPALVDLIGERTGRIADPNHRQAVLERLLPVASAAGQGEAAEAVLRSLARPAGRARGLCTLAEEAARAGDRDRARRLLREAAPVVHTVAADRDKALAALFRAATLAAEPTQAQRAFTAIGDPDQRYEAISRLTETTGPRALERFAQDIREPYQHGMAFTAIAAATARSGDTDRARLLLRIAERSARTCLAPLDRFPDPLDGLDLKVRAQILLHTLIKTSAEIGADDTAHSAITDALNLAYQDGNGTTRSRAIRELAVVSADACDRDRTVSMLNAAEESLWRVHRDDRDRELTLLVRDAARLGEHDLAEEMAETVETAHKRAQALALLATATADDARRARSLLARAETALSRRNVSNPADALKALATATARLGQHDRADEFATAVYSRDEQATTLIGLAEADLALRDQTTDPPLRTQCTNRAARRTAKALALRLWTRIYWVFDDGSGPLSFAVRLDPHCTDPLLTPEQR